MKLFSYLSIIVGCMLVIVSAIWNLSGTMGYIITTIGVLLCLLGIFINKKVREFIFNLFMENNIEYKQYYILKALRKRQDGNKFSFNDHIRALVYSLLSNQRKWKQI